MGPQKFATAPGGKVSFDHGMASRIPMSDDARERRSPPHPRYAERRRAALRSSGCAQEPAPKQVIGAGAPSAVVIAAANATAGPSPASRRS